MARIFINYAREDEWAARKLYTGLSSAGHEPWFDKDALAPGQKWKPAIERAIRDAEFFVAILSSQSVDKRGFVQREIRRALDILEEFPDSAIYLIPVRLDECEPAHSALEQLQWLDLFPTWDPGLQVLLKTLERAEVQSTQTTVHLAHSTTTGITITCNKLSRWYGRRFALKQPPFCRIDFEGLYQLQWDAGTFIDLRSGVTHTVSVFTKYLGNEIGMVSIILLLQTGETRRYRFTTPYWVWQAGLLEEL